MFESGIHRSGRFSIAAKLLITGICLISAGAFAQEATTPNTEIVLSIHADGSSPFSGVDAAMVHDAGCLDSTHPIPHTPGADGVGNGTDSTCPASANGILRTFDTVTYRADWNVNEVDATGVTTTFTLPAAIPEAQWAAVPDGCDSALSSITNNEQTLTCVIGDHEEGTFGTIFPIAEIDGTNALIDGSVLSLRGQIDSNEGVAGTSNEVNLTLSAAARYDWRKGKAYMYRNVTKIGTGGAADVNGYVIVWPIMLKPGGGNSRGLAPLNDAVPIQFYDHFFFMSSNTDATLDAELVTPATLANYGNYPSARVCGGYDGAGDEEFWDYTDNVFRKESLPYGVNGLGNANNTTLGALGAEAISCSDVTTGSYPISQIDIVNHNTSNAAPKSVTGSGSNGAVITAQIAYWVPETEIFPGSVGNSFNHNIISGTTTALDPADPIDFPTEQGDPIVVAGSSTGFETDATNNGPHTSLLKTETSPGPAAYRHFVVMHRGPYKEMQHFDPNNGLPFASIDTRNFLAGGLGQNGLYDWDGNANLATGTNDLPWGFDGEVSRNQVITVEMKVATSHNVDYSVARREAIHGCLYIDNEHMNIVDFPANFDITETTTMYEHVTPTTVGSLGTGNASHGLVHVLYGDHARSTSRSWAVSEPVRLNPAFTPNYVVEVAKAATDVGIDYERGDVRCDDAYADGGWTAIDSSTDLSAFDTDGQPGYEGIEMIRLRTLEPVPWAAPFASEWNNWNDVGAVALPRYGASFNLYVQAQVKSAVADAPTGQKIYVHAARARGEYDGTTNPEIQECTRYGNTDPNYVSYEIPAAGWCNLASLPEVGQPGQADPIEHINSTADYNILSHRDTVTIVGPRLGFSKSNADGSTDIVQNGELVTFNMRVSVTGSPTPTDEVRDIQVVDTLISEYEYVSHVDPADGSCAIAGQTLTCDFGDRVAPWSNTFSLTVRVRNAGPEDALGNTATASGVYGSDDFPVSSTGVAYSYTPGPYYQIKIKKQVPDLEGPCVHAPGEPYYGPDSGDCSWTDRDDTLHYDLEYANTGFEDMTNFRIIDVLPHLADEAEPSTIHLGSPAGSPGDFGDGRWPNTDFAGTMELVSVTPSAAGATVYYTKTPAANVNRDPDDPSNLSGFPNGTTVWCTAFSGGSCPASIAEATAFYVDLGTLAIADTGNIEIVLQTQDNVEDDIYTNSFGARSDDIRVPGRSNDVSIMIEEYDLALIKRLKAGQSAGVINGSQVIFEIVARNQGTVDSDEYSITDQIPAGMSYVTATPAPDGAPVAGLLTWTFSDPNTLAPAATQIIELTLQVDDVSQAGFRNWAEIESDAHDDRDSTPGSNDGSDPGAGVGPVGNDNVSNHNDIDHDATTQDPNDEDDSDYESLFAAEYDLALIKKITTVTPTPVVVGSQVTFEIDVMNQGNVASGAYTVADAIPPGMSFVSASPTATTDPGVGSTGTVEWLVGSGSQLAPGATTTFSITVQVDDLAFGPFRNSAEITEDSSAPYGGDSDSVAGDGSGATDTVDDSDVTNDNDPGDADDSDFALLPVGAYDLALSKTIKLIDPTPAVLGSQVTFEITVMNQGGIPSGTYTVTDLLPAGMGFVSASPAATTDPGAGVTGTVEWVVATGDELTPGTSSTFEVVAEIIDDSVGPYRNEAEITADSGDDEDSDPTDGSGASDTFNDNDVTNDNDPGDSDDSDFEQLSLTPEYDLSLIKQTISVAPTPVANGTQVTYRMTVMNQGNVNSGTFTVTDAIPAGMNFVSAMPAATTSPAVGANGNVTWVVAAADELSPGAIATFDLVVEIADDGQSPFRNAAEITEDSGAPYGGDSDSDPTDGSGATDTFNDDDVSNDSDPGDSDDSDFEELTAGGYDLALIKEFVSMAPLPTGIGTQIVFDITVMNQGGTPSGTYTFNDVLPSPLAYVQAVPAPTTHPGVGNNGTLEWVMVGANELAPGQQVTVRVTTEVTDLSLGGPFRNEAEITADSSGPYGGDEDSTAGDGSGATDSFDDQDVTNDNDPGDSDDSDWAPFEIPPVYDLALVKDITTVAPTPAAAGSQVTYTITVMNQGNMPSGTYTVDDVIPAGMNFVSANPPATSDPGAGANGPVQWVVPTGNQVAPGAQASFELVVEIADVTLAPFRNTAEISADSGAPYGGDEDSDPSDGSGATDTFDDPDVTNDNDPGDADDSDFAVLPLGGYDLALIKTITTVDPTPPALGSNVTFRITVMNQGGVPSGSYTVDDVLPPGMAFVSATPAATTDPGVGANGTVQWVVPATSELAPGATTTFDVVAELIDDTLAPYRNIADITADSGDDEDSDPTDGSGATDTFDDDDVTNDEDPGDADDSDFAEFTLDPEYDLSLIKTTMNIDPMPVATGTTVTYRMTVMNQGNVPSGTFTVTDSIPAGMNFVSASPAATTDPGVGANGAVTWVVAVADELAPGASTTFDLVVEIADDSLAPFRNESEITADSGDPYGGDSDSDPTDGSGATDTFNDDDASNDNDPDDSDDSDYEVLGAGGYDLSLVKEFVSMAPLPANLGSVLTFNITVVNQGGVASGAFTFDDVLPSPLGYVQAVPAPTSHPGIGNNGALSWSVPASSELLPGQQMTVTVTTQIVDMTYGGSFRNEAEISADGSGPYGGDEDSTAGDGSGSTDIFDDHDPMNDNDPGDSDDSDFAPFEIPPVYDLSIEKALDAQQPLWVVQGQSVNYDIVITNEGNLASNSFSIVDTVPAGLAFVSATGPDFVCTADTPAAGQVQCDYTPPTGGDLAPLQTVQVDLEMTVTDLSQAPFTNHVEITQDSASDYGLTDDDSTPGSNGAANDDGPGEGTPGEAEDDASSAVLRSASSTPITLKNFRSILKDGQLTVDWLTSMEDGNQGFLVYGRVEGGNWFAINKSMIPTRARDDEGTAYRYRINTNRRISELTLTDVDLFGSEVVHGPFKVGRRYGAFDAGSYDSNRRRRAQDDDAQQAALSKASSKFERKQLYIETSQQGVHRIRYEAVLEAGVNLKGVAMSDLALTHMGQPVPIRVNSRGREDAQFGEGSWIEFVAEGIDSLYTRANVYLLSIDPDKAARIGVERERGSAAVVRPSADYVYEWSPDRQYSRIAPGDDPWYALKLSAINIPLKKTLKMALENVDVRQPATIELDMWAAADNPTVDGDHQIRVHVNDQVVKSKVFDGVGEATMSAELPAGLLRPGINTVTLVLPLRRGTNVDTIVVDSIRLRYGRFLKPGKRQMIVDSDGLGTYRTGGFPSPAVDVYKVDEDGTTTRVKVPTRKTDSGVRLRFGEPTVQARYYVVNAASRLTPSFRRVPVFNDSHNGDAQYVVIAHRRFVNNDLRRLVDARRSEGLSARIVDVERLYAQYTGGVVDPAAIKQFVADAHRDLGTKTVLLVGGDTYDYKRNLRKRSRNRQSLAKSFIPSMYASTGQAVHHAPVDPLYGDVDDDGVPDVVIGRLPVQTATDLKLIVDKTLSYPVSATEKTAVFVADGIDDGTQRSFSAMGRAVRSRLKGWEVGLLSREKLKTTQVRSRFQSHLENGRALTVYFGHSDSNDWGFDGLVRRADVRNLKNVVNPTAVMQFGCWNTYYVAPSANTLAHHWLVEGEHGAAIVMGATTLTEAGSEQDFASFIMDGLNNGLSYGDAVLQAKAAMVKTYGLESVKDLISGFVILGDPALRPPSW